MSQPPQVWFIVGGSTGFGRSMTKIALQKGEKVVASVRKAGVLADLQAQHPDQLLVVVFDTTKYDDVRNGFQLAKKRFGRIDVVFNNAGIGIGGELEGVPEEQARFVFDVNFWGALNISREAVKTFREQTPPGGRLIQNSSNWAMECPPGAGIYSASKAALEAASESLSREIDPSWNIKITLVEPGPFKTEIGPSSFMSPPHPAYTSPTKPMSQFFADWVRPDQCSDTDDASLAFYRLAHLPNPPLRLPIHPFAVESARKKAALIKKDTEEYADWSDGLRGAS